MTVQNTTINASSLVHCPWNPRGEITAESVSDLTASIREKGLLQDIGAMPIPGEHSRFWVIYGNRRFVACKGAGMESVPVKLYGGLTERDAREITRIENEVRLGIDPLKDAELLHSFIADGRTYEDVALMFGCSAATVCRREKLVRLDESIKKIVHECPGSLPANCLENIACYPAEIQKKLSSTVSARARSGRVTWNDLFYQFNGATRDLDNSPFIKLGRGLKCQGCHKRTGCQQNLFGELEGDGKLGRCLDVSCFERTQQECIDEEIAQKVPADVERVKVDFLWQLDGEMFGKKRTKSRPACWYYVNGRSCEVHVAWGPSKAAMDAQRAEDERLKEDARQAESVRRRQQNSALEKIKAVCVLDEDGNVEKGLFDILEEHFAGAEGHERVARFLEAVVRLGVSCYYNNKDLFKASDVEDDPVLTFVHYFSDAINESADGWNSESFLVRMLNTFKGARDLVTLDEFKAVTE